MAIHPSDIGSTTPVEGERGKLLDPSEVAWADHFLLEGDHLRPKPEDADAKYTFDAYDIDEPRKTTMREGRREFVSVHWTLLEEMPADPDQLLRAADNWMRDPEVFALFSQPLLHGFAQLPSRQRKRCDQSPCIIASSRRVERNSR